MMSEQEFRRSLRIYSQSVLLGVIPSSLRAVTVGWKDTNILWHCIFDGEISEKYKELLSIAATELIANYPSPYGIYEEYIRCDAPKVLGQYRLDFWAYQRYEEYYI